MVDRIYLDTNVYCRPLDRQTSRRVKLESRAFMEIADAAMRGEIAIVSSDYVKFEIERIKDPLKRKDVRGMERVLSATNIIGNEKLVSLAKAFSFTCNLNALDALHLSTACVGDADLLLTCDDEILNKRVQLENFSVKKGHRLKVRNPVDYVMGRRRKG